MIVDAVDDVMKRPMYQFSYELKRNKNDNSDDFQWGADMSDEPELSAITSPGNGGIQNFSKASLEKLQEWDLPVSMMEPTTDRMLTATDLMTDVKNVLAGEDLSKRGQYWADKLGMSDRAFVDAQLKHYGLGSVESMRRADPAQVEVSETAPGEGDIKNEAEGYQVLRSMGFPKKGAAYIASAINHESNWRGNREWPEVANDGTNRNGGLISWASWSHDSARLGKIERHFGTEISNIPERQQLEYMAMEMRRDYPRAWHFFTTKNARSEDLRWAVANYWGFDPKFTGDRWKDAEDLIARM